MKAVLENVGAPRCAASDRGLTPAACSHTSSPSPCKTSRRSSRRSSSTTRPPPRCCRCVWRADACRGITPDPSFARRTFKARSTTRRRPPRASTVLRGRHERERRRGCGEDRAIEARGVVTRFGGIVQSCFVMRSLWMDNSGRLGLTQHSMHCIRGASTRSARGGMGRRARSRLRRGAGRGAV